MPIPVFSAHHTASQSSEPKQVRFTLPLGPSGVDFSDRQVVAQRFRDALLASPKGITGWIDSGTVHLFSRDTIGQVSKNQDRNSVTWSFMKNEGLTIRNHQNTPLDQAVIGRLKVGLQAGVETYKEVRRDFLRSQGVPKSSEEVQVEERRLDTLISRYNLDTLRPEASVVEPEQQFKRQLDGPTFEIEGVELRDLKRQTVSYFSPNG